MIAPRVKYLGSQTRNASFLISLCQHCQKKIFQSPQISSANISSHSGFPATSPLSTCLKLLPKCSQHGMQNIRHLSKLKDSDDKELKASKRDKLSENQETSLENQQDENLKTPNIYETKAQELLLETLTENQEMVKCVSVVPGKKPPPDPPLDCCMSGCANCVWIKYAEDMRDYYCEGGIEKALKDIENIKDANLKAYLKLELSFINK